MIWFTFGSRSVSLGHVGFPVTRCAGMAQTLRYWDAASGQDRPVATLEADFIRGLSVSPDGRLILFGRVVRTTDLMLIENFR